MYFLTHTYEGALIHIVIWTGVHNIICPITPIRLHILSLKPTSSGLKAHLVSAQQENPQIALMCTLDVLENQNP